MVGCLSLRLADTRQAAIVDTRTTDAGWSLGAKSSAMALEVGAWALLALLSALAIRAYRPMPLLDDSYQYLNVAENLQHGRGVTTALIHFDPERSHGRMPAPLTTFPPGYAAVIAATGYGRDLEATARLVSCVCYAATAACLMWAMVLTSVTIFLRQAILFLFVTNAVALSFAASVLTEPLYMLLSTGSVVGLIWAEKAAETGLPKHSVIGRAAIAYSLAGLAYWVRYAGLFLIVAVVGYALLQLALERSRLRAVLLLTTLIPVAMAAALMLRNVVTVGTWKGGNDMAVQNPLKTVAADHVRAHLHLMLGGHAATFGVFEGLLLAGLAFLGFVAVRQVGAYRNPDAAALLVALCVLIYSAGIFYAGLRTVISFGTRMFLPVLPLYLLLLGMGVNRVARGGRADAPSASPLESRWLKLALLLVIAASASVNARDLYEPRVPAPHEILAGLYAQPVAGGQPLLKWVESNIGADDVVVATDGQATGYLLHRPTISMVGPHYSPVRWECDEVKEQMRRFKSSYVILYKPPPTPSPTPADDFLVAGSQFVAAAASREPPCGFVVSVENPGVRILKLGGAEPALPQY
jgi:hypothetical protein